MKIFLEQVFDVEIVVIFSSLMMFDVCLTVYYLNGTSY